jgi:hypothetical protein
MKATTMLRTPRLWKLLSLCLLAQAGAAMAQQPNTAPPKLERIEEGSDTPITVTPPKAGDRKITEKKEGGRVTEVKVRQGKSEYTMRPNVPAGNAQPGDAVSNSIRAPQWTVLEFDLNKKKNTDKESVPATADAPPPPAANSVK